MVGSKSNYYTQQCMIANRKSNVGGGMTPEGKVKAAVKKVLKPYVDRGVIWFDMPVPGGYGKPTLDFLLCVLGTFVAIETKAPGNKPTPRQEITISQIERAGGVVFVIDDVNATGPLAEFFKRIVNEHGVRQPKTQDGGRRPFARGAKPVPQRGRDRHQRRVASRRAAWPGRNRDAA